MRTLILSTCGTSLLTNLADGQRELVVRYANARTSAAVPEMDRRPLEALIDRARQHLRKEGVEEQATRSAELNGLLRYYRGRLDQSHDTHWLIATDTWLGRATAETIGEVLESAGHKVEIKPIQDLRTDSLSEFRSAMAELARLCAQELQGMREGGWRVVFNLTGGFKSVQGFMQALGMLYADESVYVFERTKELLRLPRLPLSLDAHSLLRAHQRIFRRLAVGLPVTKADADADDMPDTLLMEEDGQVALSVWGDVVWAQAGSELLEERLWDPVDTKLRFGPKFERSVSDCDGMRRRHINERLAQLGRHLNEQIYNPSGLDFKALKGKHGVWTHECDAWADLDAKRIFGHFEDGVYVVDALAKGLH